MALAFCSPRRFARRDEEVEILEVVEYWEMVEEERVKVMDGWDCSGLGVKVEFDREMPHPPVASVTGGFGGGGGILF
jgi:hypothetical protein